VCVCVCGVCGTTHKISGSRSSHVVVVWWRCADEWVERGLTATTPCKYRRQSVSGREADGMWRRQRDDPGAAHEPWGVGVAFSTAALTASADSSTTVSQSSGSWVDADVDMVANAHVVHGHAKMSCLLALRSNRCLISLQSCAPCAKSF
jgi:hypothetical protein